MALDFAPLFESLDIWGPDNPALVLVKHLCGEAHGRKTSCKNGDTQEANPETR